MIKFLVNQLPNLPLIGLDVVSQAVTPLRPTLCTTPETLGWTSNRYLVAYLLVVRPRLTQRVVGDDSAGGEISKRKGENIEDCCDVCIPLVVRILYPGGHALPAVDGEGELLGPDVLPELGPGGHQLGLLLQLAVPKTCEIIIETYHHLLVLIARLLVGHLSPAGVVLGLSLTLELGNACQHLDRVDSSEVLVPVDGAEVWTLQSERF